jgi:hypothetical protein
MAVGHDQMRDGTLAPVTVNKTRGIFRLLVIAREYTPCCVTMEFIEMPRPLGLKRVGQVAHVARPELAFHAAEMLPYSPVVQLE